MRHSCKQIETADLDRMERLAAGAQLLRLPLAALVSVLGRLAAAPRAAAAAARRARARGRRRHADGRGVMAPARPHRRAVAAAPRPAPAWWPWAQAHRRPGSSSRVVAWLLVRQARTIDWSEVLALGAAHMPLPTLLAAAAARRLQPRALQQLRPARPPHDRPHARHRHGDGRHLHQLRLQPQPRLAGRRHRLPLPPLFAAGPGQRHHHARARLQHADQLARLPGGRRRRLLLLAAGAAARLEDRQRRPAHPRRRAAAAGRWPTWRCARSRASTPGTSAATSWSRRRCAWRCCSWRCPAPTGR